MSNYYFIFYTTIFNDRKKLGLRKKKVLDIKGNIFLKVFCDLLIKFQDLLIEIRTEQTFNLLDFGVDGNAVNPGETTNLK